MADRNKVIDTLVHHLHRLPGVGPKMAERIAFHLFRMNKEDAEGLYTAIADVRSKIHTCRTCFNLTEENPCRICSDITRNTHQVCVVEHPQDLSAVEKSGGYKGLYHILQGSLSPLDGVGPDDLKIDELVKRLKNNTITEVIIATNTDVEGEATAVYLSKFIKPLHIKVTRIAQGLPYGGELEYADQGTLLKALEGRREI
ncbi:MAG: recombination mediator RecR [bacterium]